MNQFGNKGLVPTASIEGKTFALIFLCSSATVRLPELNKDQKINFYGRTGKTQFLHFWGLASRAATNIPWSSQKFPALLRWLPSHWACPAVSKLPSCPSACQRLHEAQTWHSKSMADKQSSSWPSFWDTAFNIAHPRLKVSKLSSSTICHTSLLQKCEKDSLQIRHSAAFVP